MLLPAPGFYSHHQGEAMFGKGHQRREAEITRALNHPLRLRILEMHKRMQGESLSVQVLTAALGETREYKGIKAAEVKYHRDRLVAAELLTV